WKGAKVCLAVAGDNLRWIWRASVRLHEEASVKTGARRLRDFPDIHSASAAQAARHERVCGCPHSRRRRRTAPCRTPGCNLSPALDPDVKPSSDRRTAHRGTPPATEKMASGGPGGGQ